MEEVFCKADILEGMALSVLRDLRDMPVLRDEVAEALKQDDSFSDYIEWLFPRLYRVEAKYPAYFNYDTEGRRAPSRQ